MPGIFPALGEIFAGGTDFDLGQVARVKIAVEKGPKIRQIAEGGVEFEIGRVGFQVFDALPESGVD